MKIPHSLHYFSAVHVMVLKVEETIILLILASPLMVEMWSSKLLFGFG